MQAGTGTDTLIAFTLPGQVAADGRERNSPSTKHLLRQLVVPDVPVEEVFKRVRTSVVQETGGKQRSQEWNASTQDFRFVEGPLLQSPPIPAAGLQVAVGVYPQSPAASTTYRNSIGMECVLIPAGPFQMGSNDNDADDGQQPVHTVRITQPFSLGKYEVGGVGMPSRRQIVRTVGRFNVVWRGTALSGW